LNEQDFREAIVLDRKWKGIEYLVRLKKEGDPRFADFELVDRGNTALCLACEVGDYGLVEYLLCRIDYGKYVLPGMKGVNFTRGLKSAIRWHQMKILRFFLTMKDGKYVLPGLKGVDLGEALVAAIMWNRLEMVRFLLKMEYGGYVLLGMNSIDLAQVLTTAIKENRIELVEWLLRMNEFGEYVLPGIRVTEDMLGIGGQSPEVKGLLEMHLGQQRGNM
jgi:hypothetical protein